MSLVLHLFLGTALRRPMREVQSALAVPDCGLEGCRHARPGRRRQVLLMDCETLECFGLMPGQIKENITTRGLRVNDLSKGQRLEFGQAVLEVTGPCEPCERMDEIRTGLKQELYGRRGVLCRVIEGGQIQRGDTIQVVAAVAAPTIGGER
jgi:MOSC domain-containing protein YiiM